MMWVLGFVGFLLGFLSSPQPTVGVDDVVGGCVGVGWGDDRNPNTQIHDYISKGFLSDDWGGCDDVDIEFGERL